MINPEPEPRDDLMSDLDPDLNYYTELVSSNTTESKYYSIEEYNKSFRQNSSYINLINFNIRSYFANFDSYAALLGSLSVETEVLVLSETWLTEEKLSGANIAGYEGYHTVRCTDSGRGGGVSVYCASYLNSKPIHQFSVSNQNIECCCVAVEINKESHFILAVYRPHVGTILNFTEAISSILNDACFTGKKVILTGDLNLNLLDSDNNHISNFMNEMYSLHFLPKILKPTRFPTGNFYSPTLLDQVWVNYIDNCTAGIIWSDITDHCPCFLRINASVAQPTDLVKLTFRKYNSNNVDNFVDNIFGVNWSEKLVGSVDSKFEVFLQTLSEIYCQNFPLIKKTISNKRCNKPWLTSGLIQSIKTKSKYFKLYKQGIITKEFNNSYKNLLNSLVRKSKQNYYKIRFRDSAGNIKKTWSNIREIMSNSKNKKSVKSIIINSAIVNDPNLIADHFNEYFTTIAASLEQNIPQTNISPLHYVKGSNINSLFLSPVTFLECSNIIGKLKPTGQDTNDPSIRVWKEAKEALAVPISNLINECFSVGEFPYCLKHAIVTPIHKSGLSTDLNNFRPIAVLLILSKIFEKLIYSRLVNFALKNKILSPNHF